ncbi:MAG: hypothetical protein US76_01610 [Parcubacteria group bacterium GW2011_GWA2_38_13b]|nr:MAG: hypothetical protein US76_01610 [Parcubacteria group bacterium GW2011_GWA2_38_13b]
MEIAKKLAHYVNSVSFENLKPEVVNEVKRRIIDSFGCALGAWKFETIKKIYGITPKSYGYNNIGHNSTIIRPFAMPLTDTVSAAFINGAAIRYLDYNDTYLNLEPAHPSDNIAVLLAFAEEKKSTTQDFIMAITLSYEIQCRLCDAASLRKNGWDHVTYLPISVACGASKLAKFNIEQTRNAIAIAIAMGAYTRQTRVGELSEWKGFAAANAACNGLRAVKLVEAGISGPQRIFEGTYGFRPQLFRTGDFKESFYQFLEEKPVPEKILETYIKNWPVEYHIQAPVETILNLRKNYPEIADINSIISVKIETYEAAVSIVGGDKSKWNPKTRETADHSIPYCVARALIDGKIDLDSFTEEKIRDPNVKKLINKIIMREDANFTALYGKSFPVAIEIVKKIPHIDIGVRTINSKTTYYPKGHPRNPLTGKELESKFTELTSGFNGMPRYENFFCNIRNMEQLSDIKNIWLHLRNCNYDNE